MMGNPIAIINDHLNKVLKKSVELVRTIFFSCKRFYALIKKLQIQSKIICICVTIRYKVQTERKS